MELQKKRFRYASSNARILELGVLTQKGMGSKISSDK
jgi:hypothetical protein